MSFAAVGLHNQLSQPDLLRQQYSDSERLRIREETHERYREGPTSYVEWLVAHVAIHPGQVLVDIGCGYGAYHALFTTLGARVIGVDLSPGMLKEAAGGCLAIQGDMHALPIASRSCDRVTAFHVLHHASDPLQALREMQRVLRPHGRVVVAANAPESMHRLRSVVQDAELELGRSPRQPPDREPFNLRDIGLVREVFLTADVRVFRDALVFPSVEPVLRYLNSAGLDLDLVEPLRRRIGAIVDREGAFRVEKIAGCFVADT